MSIINVMKLVNQNYHWYSDSLSGTRNQINIYVMSKSLQSGKKLINHYKHITIWNETNQSIQTYVNQYNLERN